MQQPPPWLRRNVNDLRKTLRSGYVAALYPVVVARNISFSKAIALEELKFDYNGLIIQAHPVRRYPYGSCASHILGYLNEIDLGG